MLSGLGKLLIFCPENPRVGGLNPPLATILIQGVRSTIRGSSRKPRVRVNKEVMVDEELIEFVCLENQRFGR